jgi:hypothetical protein
MKNKILVLLCTFLMFSVLTSNRTLSASISSIESAIKLAEKDAAVLKSEVDINVRKKKYPKSPISSINKNSIIKANDSYKKVSIVVNNLPIGKQKNGYIARLDKNVKVHIQNANLYNKVINTGETYKKNVELYIKSYMLNGEKNKQTIDLLNKSIQAEKPLTIALSNFKIAITKNALKTYYNYETIMKNELPKYQVTTPVFPEPNGEILLFAQDNNNTFLGKLTTNKYDSDSIFNEFGTYGSKYSSTSIWNEYGTFGSKYSTYSAFNPYSTVPPMMVQNGEVIGYLTVNKYLADGFSPFDIFDILTDSGY